MVLYSLFFGLIQNFLPLRIIILNIVCACFPWVLCRWCFIVGGKILTGWWLINITYSPISAVFVPMKSAARSNIFAILKQTNIRVTRAIYDEMEKIIISIFHSNHPALMLEITNYILNFATLDSWNAVIPFTGSYLAIQSKTVITSVRWLWTVARPCSWLFAWPTRITANSVVAPGSPMSVNYIISSMKWATHQN